MVYCLLDIFPVELIHHLLNYFLTHEIFHTFTNVSPYIDNVLLVYSNYRLNFKSITKKEFDLVCQRIIPNQVISLTLCDNENTPGQVELFLSRFQINQFTRLHSLTLIDVGPDFWEPIVTKLIELKNLRSFFYHVSKRNDSWISKIPRDNVTLLDMRLFDSYSPVLSQLNWLQLSHGNYFKSVQFPYLLHLIIGPCTIDILQHISRIAPQLKSMETGFQHDKASADLVLPFGQLKRLILRIEYSAVPMASMEQLIVNLPKLEYLELHANGGADLLDGQRWQTATRRLSTFNFMFVLSGDLDIQDLDSFRTSYWLNEKHWFVAYVNRSLFSVPFFAETFTNEEFQPPILSTVPDDTIFYNCITQLTLSEPFFQIKHRFTQVQALTMFCSVPLSTVERTIDLTRIQHLSLDAMTDYLGIIFVINEMPNLCRISIKREVKDFLKEAQCHAFEKIRYLEIGNRYADIYDDDDDDDYDNEQLYSVFPCVQNLYIVYYCSITQILNFINRFKDLSTASFSCRLGCYEGYENKNVIKVQLALDENRSSHKLDYTYRFGSSSVYIWL